MTDKTEHRKLVTIEKINQALSSAERSTVWNACKVAADRFREDAKNLRDVAAELRAGKSVTMFTPGEDGARGADRLAEQFEKQERETLALIEYFEE